MKKKLFKFCNIFYKIGWFLWFYLKCFPRIIGTVNLTSIKSFRSWFKIFSIIYSYWRLLLEPAIFPIISTLFNICMDILVLPSHIHYIHVITTVLCHWSHFCHCYNFIIIDRLFKLYAYAWSIFFIFDLSAVRCTTLLSSS